MKQTHSKRYREQKKLIGTGKIHTLSEAVDLILQTGKTKFPSSVEIHVRLGINPKKSEQQIRSTFTLPHGSGKEVRVAAFVSGDKIAEAKSAGADLVGGDDLIEEIKKTNKCDFSVAVATPEMMKKLAMIAKTLGPRGLMPSPKNETVTENIKGIISELKRGKITLRTDDTGNVHQLIGKVTLGKEKLLENISAFSKELKRVKPSGLKIDYIQSATLTTTMGPGIKVSIE